MRYFNNLRNRLAGYFRWNSLWVLVSLMTSIIAIVVIITIITLINDRFDESINHTTQQNSSQIVDSVSASIDRYLKDMIYTSDIVTDILRNNKDMHYIPSDYFLKRDDINTIAIFDTDANIIATTDIRPIKDNGYLKQQDWFQSIINTDSVYSFTNPRVQRLYYGKYPWVISLSKSITLTDAYGESIRRFVLVDLNFNNIKEMCSRELGKAGYIYILGPEDKVIYHPRQQMIYAGIVPNDIPMMAKLPEGNTIIESNGERVSVNVRTLSNANWRIYGVSPLRGFFSYDNEIYNFVIVIISLSILMVILLAVLVSMFITRPVRKLMEMMRHVESGDFDMVCQVKGAYEVGELSRSFSQMVYRIKYLMEELRKEQEQIRKEQAQLRKSEMKVLQSQLNPHFLYNTLDSIVWMAEAGDQKNVIKMIDALAHFFRLTLSGGDEMIPVENELKHTENYLIIQKMRYDEQFDYTISSQADCLGYVTLKNIIQPIVENAIIHGVGNMQEQGHISVSAYRNSQTIIFEINDNGCGIKPKTLENILEAKISTKSGVGVRNVNKRIQLMFGKDYGLKYESELDVGTTVKITLPLITLAERSDVIGKTN